MRKTALALLLLSLAVAACEASDASLPDARGSDAEGAADPGDALAAPSLLVEPTELHFEQITGHYDGGVVTITNPSTRLVHLETATAGMGPFVVGPWGFPEEGVDLMPGTWHDLEVGFWPSVVGEHEGTLTITTDEPAAYHVRLFGIANRCKPLPEERLCTWEDREGVLACDAEDCLFLCDVLTEDGADCLRFEGSWGQEWVAYAGGDGCQPPVPGDRLEVLCAMPTAPDCPPEEDYCEPRGVLRTAPDGLTLTQITGHYESAYISVSNGGNSAVRVTMAMIGSRGVTEPEDEFDWNGFWLAPGALPEGGVLLQAGEDVRVDVDFAALHVGRYDDRLAIMSDEPAWYEVPLRATATRCTHPPEQASCTWQHDAGGLVCLPDAQTCVRICTAPDECSAVQDERGLVYAGGDDCTAPADGDTTEVLCAVPQPPDCPTWIEDVCEP